MLLYLDICCFNRPFDPQTQLQVSLETQAKTYIQQKMLVGEYQFLWSYVLEYENNRNPFDDRKRQTKSWHKLAANTILESDAVLAAARTLANQGIRKYDALHIACAIVGKSDYFLTVDKKLLNKEIEGVEVINPIDFIRKEG